MALRLTRLAQDKVFGMLASQAYSSDDELYIHLISIVANTFALLLHLFFLFFFSATGVTALLVHNSVSILLYIICYVIINRRKYALAGVLLAASVILYTLHSVYLLGFSQHVVLYFFILLVMQLSIPYARARVRAIVLTGEFACIVMSLWMEGTLMPLVSLSASQAFILSAFNISATFFGIILELSLGNMIRALIQAFNTQKMDRYRSQAYTDPLTGLHNRRYADLQFERLRGENENARFCVAMLDIDDFKKVNDTYGHSTGDQVLAFIAKTMRTDLRKKDLLFRWGGEEFLILLEDVDPPTAYNILEKLRVQLSAAKLEHGQNEIRFTVTIGIAQMDLTHVQKSIDQCDQKLYQGKSTGKNKVVF